MPAEAGNKEHRIVAESVGALLVVGDNTLHGPLARHHSSARFSYRDRASESCGPLPVRHIAHHYEKLEVSSGVGRRETAGENARSSVNGIDFQPGVVGYGKFSRKLRVSASLYRGVLGECSARFFDIRRVGVVGQRDYFERQSFEHLRDLARLAAVLRRDNQPAPEPGRLLTILAFHFRLSAQATSARVVFSFAVISVIPFWARSMRLLKRFRVNGAPSAVAWTSTTRPEAVITTFMSTEALESSL